MGLNFKSHRMGKMRLQMARPTRPLPVVGVCGATPEIVACEVENRFKRRFAALSEFLAITSLSARNISAARKAIVGLREDYGEDLDKQVLIAKLDELLGKAHDRWQRREAKRAAMEEAERPEPTPQPPPSTELW